MIMSLKCARLPPWMGELYIVKVCWISTAALSLKSTSHVLTKEDRTEFSCNQFNSFFSLFFMRRFLLLVALQPHLPCSLVCLNLWKAFHLLSVRMKSFLQS